MKKPLIASLTLALAVSTAHVLAQTQPAPMPPGHAMPMSTLKFDVPAAASAPVATVDAFVKALAGNDLKRVEALLAPNVVILESGGAERSRAEYLGHHAKSDAELLAHAHIALMRRTARVDGAVAWVASESELHASKDGKPMTLLSTETMVLHKTADGWRIVHIHWSSRPKKDS